MKASYDLTIIGTGPAGMSAAIIASRLGASVLVLDEKAQAGGQIYRNVQNSPLENSAALGKDYTAGKTLVDQFTACSAEKQWSANVWHVGDNGEILFSQQQQTYRVTSREILVSCGAMERPFPISGWHLKGVMTAGSAQVMLKSNALVYDDAIFVGTGPLLYLIVAQYLRLGVRVKALVDTTPKSNYFQALSHLPKALYQPNMLIKGLGLLNEIRQAGIPVYRFAADLTIHGDEHVQSLSFQTGNKKHELATSHVFLHQGVIPNLNMTRSIGLEHEWNQQQLCWQPTLNQWGQSSVTNMSVAGDSSGIVGAEGAALMGEVAALNQCYQLNLISKSERDQQAKPKQKKLSQLNNFRTFIDRLYQPQVAHRIPQNPDTIVCRCEEQSMAQLKQGFEQGAHDPNALKGQTRCGMGPCQGRQCGYTISELLAQWQHKPVKEIGYYRMRSPMRLLSLQELAQFNQLTPKGDQA